MERKTEKLSAQMKRRSEEVAEKKKEYDGNFGTVISTGSTLLDLAISGGRVRGGGLPGGIMVEIFGPSAAGKTVLLCEIAGGVQRQGGDVRFDDPEARLNKEFARIFDLNTDELNYAKPNMVTEVFENIRKWKPSDLKKINGTFTDSLAALSTELEMGDDDGDKMGMRRAKEFSEGLRKNARILAENNYLMVCSNQIRENVSGYGPKITSPGGKAIGFYASLRLKADNPTKIFETQKYKGKEIKQVIGVETEFEVFKSSIWEPFHTAPVNIIFQYGIDDVRGNLQFMKKYLGNKMYTLDGERDLEVSMKDSIKIIETEHLEAELKNNVIDLWETIQEKFETKRQPKQR
jgi:recombination protein RecA